MADTLRITHVIFLILALLAIPSTLFASPRTWQPLIDALHARASLHGLFVIVDARRGLAAGDAGLLEWAAPEHRVHVLLAKADKLNRSEAGQALRDAMGVLGARGSVQLFSALKGTGVAEAEDTLAAWLN